MSKQDIMWLEQCKQNPRRYKIWVDNDCLCVEDVVEENNVHTFESFGYKFARDLLEHIGCSAEMV